MLADPFVQEQASRQAPIPAQPVAAAQPPEAVQEVVQDVAPSVAQLWQLRAPAGLCEATAVRVLTGMGLRVVRRCWVAAAQAGGSPELLLQTAPAPDAQLRVALAHLRRKTGADVQCQPGQPAPAAARMAAEI